MKYTVPIIIAVAAYIVMFAAEASGSGLFASVGLLLIPAVMAGVAWAAGDFVKRDL